MLSRRNPNPNQKVNRGGLGRAMKYLWNYKLLALVPYLFLTLATLSQLAVPRMVRNIIDAITQGSIAGILTPFLSQIPESFLSQILQRIGMTQDELIYYYR